MARILIADPEPFVRRMLSHALERSGYSVSCVRDGAGTLAAIAERKPDVLIVDANLPDLDARQLCQSIDETWMARDFFVCVTSARLADGDHQWVRELADAVFIAKPISVLRLVTAIERHLNRGDAQNAC